jgi:DNA-binding GntR family transcriptional regulator
MKNETLFFESKLNKSEPIREQLASLLRRKIITGQLEPGRQIVERDISENFNISTTPVKEAIRVLVAEGLLISVPPTRYFCE